MSYVAKTFIAILLAVTIVTASSHSVEQTQPIQVAVSVYNTGPGFMKQWLAALRQHPAVLDGRVLLDVFNCGGSHAFQLMNIETITAANYDAAILVANDYHASKRLAELLADAGIPVVASCAQTSAEILDAFIGPDDVIAGYLTATSVAEKLQGRGNVVVLRGPLDQGATQHRSLGISKALAAYSGIQEIRSFPANWSRAEAMQVVQGMIDRSLRIDGIIAQNDEMALGAIEILKKNDQPAIPVASIDGLDAAVAAVERGELLQTLRQDSALQAQGALDLALRELLGPEYAPESPAWRGEMLEQWHTEAQQRFIVPWEVVAAGQ